MASPQQTGHRHAGGHTQDAVRRAKLHLTAASNMLDSAATAITRATELADERDGVGDELADDLAIRNRPPARPWLYPRRSAPREGSAVCGQHHA